MCLSCPYIGEKQNTLEVWVRNVSVSISEGTMHFQKPENLISDHILLQI